MIQYNLLLYVFLVLFLARLFCRLILAGMNITHLRRFGHQVPEAFEGAIESETLSRMTDYTIDSSRFGSLEAFFESILLLFILMSGFLPWLSGTILSLDCHFIISGLLFFLALGAIGFLTEIPFNLYESFVIEKKYGFSTITPTLWITDLIKSTLISCILLGALLGSLLALIHHARESWWLFGWAFFASFQLFIMWIYPIVIAPLFNKYEPLPDENLKDTIVSVMEKAGLKTSGVFRVDAGKRSRHSNAYFTGIGKTKRIVLYDTLLESHTDEEIVSVLAHEIGHWKKGHIIKQLLLIEVISFVLFYAVYRLLDWPYLYQTFGFESSIPYAGLFLLSAIFSPFSFFLKPIGAGISRRYEREADNYSGHLLGTTGYLAGALKRLAKDNLANLHPHPFYAWFYYSHPPLTERIDYLTTIEEDLSSPG
jgi:STE24 endopeptidase